MSIQIVNFRPKGDQAWTQSAECAKPNQPLMFPDEGDAVGIEQARDVCNACPVRQQCLSEALDRNESHGMWGGMTAAERRVIRRKAARIPNADRATAMDVAARPGHQDASPIVRPLIG
jgi:WhiB family redox-sensing transcriptional regulator